MKQLFLLRHGKTEYSNKYIGATDVALSKEGVNDLILKKKYLQGFDFDKIICSPLSRCRQTCEIIKLQCEFEIDRRIREIDFGRWEEKTFKQIEQSDPELVKIWAAEDHTFAFPEGEQILDFHKRIDEFCNSLKSLKAKKLLIVTHGGVIRHVICNFLRISYDNYLYFQIQHGKITTINLHNQGGILTGMNLGDIHE